MTKPNSAYRTTQSYFFWPFIVTIGGLLTGSGIGWLYDGLSGALYFLFICAVLSVLEISLSFDNAIVNANKLKSMSPKWQRRFLTWGILIAVFGMRVVFPLLIVVIAADVGPVDAVVLAVRHPSEYAEIMRDSHLVISAFGGTFLMMVALNYFFDQTKEVHWFSWIEAPVARSAAIRGIEIAVALVIVLVFSHLVHENESEEFLHAAVFGLVTFLGVETLSGFLDAGEQHAQLAARGGLGAFIYLEVLDASFSFDGVIGAFALSQNMLVIAIGLGIGAMYVRSMTIMLVERGSLAEYRFLEHGAFYAILVLSVIMFLQSLVHVPEVFTGLLGAAFIGVSLWASVLWKRRQS